MCIGAKKPNRDVAGSVNFYQPIPMLKCLQEKVNILLENNCFLNQSIKARFTNREV